LERQVFARLKRLPARARALAGAWCGGSWGRRLARWLAEGDGDQDTGSMTSELSAEDWVELHAVLAAWYAVGGQLRVEAIWPSGRRVPLPCYPFERRRYWLPTAASEASPPAAEIIAEAEPSLDRLSSWFFEPHWERYTAETHTPPSGRWQVIDQGDASLSQAIVEALTAAGCEVGQSSESSPAPAGVVLVTGQPQAWDDTADAASVQAELLAGLQRLVTQTATLVDQHEAAEPLPVWIISRGGQPVEASSISDPRAAATAALSQVIDQEYTELRCRVLDLPRTLAATPAAAHVLASLGWQDPPPLAAWREETAWVRHWRPSDVGPLADGQPPLRAGGVYLLSGGQGNIGLELAARLAAAGTPAAPVRLVLASRQPLPEASQWDAYLAAPADNPGWKVLSVRSPLPHRGGTPCLFAMCDDN